MIDRLDLRLRAALAGSIALCTLGLTPKVGGQQAGNLLTNGSFEIGGLGTCNHNCHGGLPGWASNSWCSIDWVRTETCAPFCIPAFTPPEGHCIVDLSGSLGIPGTIWQPVTLVPGRSYILSFAFGGNCGGDSPLKRMSVSIGPVEQEFTWNCQIACYEFGPAREIEFVPVVASNILKFTSLSNPNYGPMIDDVQLIEAPSCPADINQSGTIDAEDLAYVLFAWGMTGGKAGDADINGDAIVDANDLSLVLGSWGQCPN